MEPEVKPEKETKKKKVVKKVAAETGIEAKELERLDVPALEKIDALVPDADLDVLGGGEEKPMTPSRERQIIGHKADGTPIFMPRF